MEQLEIREYKREEIAEVLEVKISNHFKRDVTSKLDKWGYSYNYTSKKVTITEKPTAAAAKLNEIMVRVYGLDIQINPIGFAGFMFLLAYCEEFQTMPWEERAKMLEHDYHVKVDEKTLRRWADKLFKKEMLFKDSSSRTSWITMYIDGKKVREMVDGNPALERDMDEYKKTRLERYRVHYRENRETMDEDEASSAAWKQTFTDLWETYHCCYYTCKALMLNAFGDEAQEIFELVNEIAEL